MRLYLLFCILCLLSCLPVGAQTAADSTDVPSVRPATEHCWLWGAGSGNVLDTYLSPLEYTGPNFSLLHRTERPFIRRNQRLKVQGLYTGHLAYLHSPTDDGKEWDAEISAAGGCLYDLYRTPHWRLAAGALAELTGGFTYNTRGSNNPAQGRLGISLSATALAQYAFRFFRHPAKVTVQTDFQMVGAQFSPEYGQSYYEIFSLGHTSGIVHFTHPGNCPTGRLQAYLTLPLCKANWTLGYLADVRQSKLGGLKRHAWRNCFMIGYTRHLQLIRP